MSSNSIGKNFTFTTWGESHGKAIGCVIDGVPSNINLGESDIQPFLNKRKPGQSKYTTQRKEDDKVEILSGVFEGMTTGHPVSLIIHNSDQRSKDYSDIKDKFRPGHADYTYWKKYGIRDYRGGGRSSARETAMRVAAGAIARKIINQKIGNNSKITGALVQIGNSKINYNNWNDQQISENEKGIDYLINNAGAAWGEPLEDFSETGWDKVMDLNVKSIFFLTQKLKSLLKTNATIDDPSRVINIGSIDGLNVPAFETYSYSTSKAAVHHLTRVLANKLVKEDILVNAIAPGPYPSNMLGAAVAHDYSEIAKRNPRKRAKQKQYFNYKSTY